MNTPKFDWTEFLERNGAIWRHTNETNTHASYEWTSSHTDFYLNTDEIAAAPRVVGTIIKEAFYPQCASLSVDWILSYSASIAASLILAASLSAALDCRLTYLDLRTRRLSLPIDPSNRVLIVTDDIYSGGSIKALLDVISASGAIALSPILTVGNFSGHDSIADLPIFALLTRTVHSWTPDQCPLCRAGSRPLAARQSWRDLRGKTD